MKMNLIPDELRYQHTNFHKLKHAQQLKHLDWMYTVSVYCFHNPQYSKAVWTISMIVRNQKHLFALFLQPVNTWNKEQTWE